MKNNDKLDQYRSVSIIVSDDALTFTMVPKKGFFGIGKSKAECFTCPKEIYPKLKQEFDLSKTNLQQKAHLRIDCSEYPFIVRLVNMNRSKVRKLLPSKLNKRETIQFSWKSNPDTQAELKSFLSNEYDSLRSDSDLETASITFKYIGNRLYELIGPLREGQKQQIETEDGLNKFEYFIKPTWEVLNQYGRLQKHQIDELVADSLELTKQQREILHKNGPRTSLDYRMSWARTYLKQSGIATNPKKGYWENTEFGQSIEDIDINWVKQKVNEYQEAKNKNKQNEIQVNKNIQSEDNIVANIPSSFVQRKIKLANDRGNGEAKLYIGPVKNKEGYEIFFYNWHPMNTYELDQVELLLYLQDVELEFSKQSKYKAVSKKLHRELFNKVESLEDNRIDLAYHEDKSRYYIRGTSDAWKLIRQTCLPLITTLSIEVKSRNDDGSCDYVVRILRSNEERTANPTSGIKSKSRKKKPQRKTKQNKIKTIAEDSRTISDDLKDRVWRRDQGMCQANYKLDSRFEKNTGEICGSNENLEFDHIVPFSKGGKTTYRNLQLLCRTHNRIKSDREI